MTFGQRRISFFFFFFCFFFWTEKDFLNKVQKIQSETLNLDNHNHITQKYFLYVKSHHLETKIKAIDRLE